MLELAPELWLVLPLAVAAGLDLYLTLLILGAAPTLPWWDRALPGALGDLDATSIVVVVGIMYALEFLAERRPASALLWNATHALIRPVSGALLIALLLHGTGPGILLPAALVGGLVTSVVHAVRSGGAILRWLDPGPDPNPLLLSCFEDTLVFGLVAASLDSPHIALASAGAVLLLGLPRAASRLRAFVFATRLAAVRTFQSFRQRRWTPNEALPAWVRATLQDNVLAPGGGLRGARVGLMGMPGMARFLTGWLVVRGNAPVLVLGPIGRSGRLAELDMLTASEVGEEDFYRRVDLRDEECRPVRFFFFINGPSPAALAAEFGLPSVGSRTDTAEKNL